MMTGLRAHDPGVLREKEYDRMKKKMQNGGAEDPGLDQADLEARDILRQVADHEDDPDVDTENFHEPGSERCV